MTTLETTPDMRAELLFHVRTMGLDGTMQNLQAILDDLDVLQAQLDRAVELIRDCKFHIDESSDLGQGIQNFLSAIDAKEKP